MAGGLAAFAELGEQGFVAATDALARWSGEWQRAVAVFCELNAKW